LGCKYACTCGGFCPGCQSYEKEDYCGHAEDYHDSIHGHENLEKENYLSAMRDEYEKAMRDEYENTTPTK
jgi:hypothetical protein